MNKIGIRASILLCLVGVCFISSGIGFDWQNMIFAGIVTCTFGMTSLGLRIYDRVKEKAREKRSL